MADPYSGVSITGYNSNPPADDGSQTEANRVKWATIKSKLNDPVKSRTDNMDTALIAAFAKMLGGAGITSTAISYTVLSTDQGKLVRATAAGITITSPDATDVDAPFVFCLLNDSTGDITFDGSGSQTVDGDTSVTVPAGCGLTVFTDGSNWFTAGQNFQRTLVRPQGYLTLMSVASQPTSPMPTSDQSAKTSVFYRPDQGNLLPIPDGTNFAVREFSEFALTLASQHVANGIYDYFAWDDGGTIRTGTGPVWSNVTAGSCSRGTGAGTTELDILRGLFVNKVAMTVRNGASTFSVGARCGVYLGSIFIDGSAGQVTCHTSFGQSRKWGVWNAYNRRRLFLQAGDATGSWNYTTSAYRASNNAAANSLTVFSGLGDEICNSQFAQYLTFTNITNGNTGVGTIAIGYNSASTPSGRLGQMTFANNNVGNVTIAGFVAANFRNVPSIGINTVTSLENGGGSFVGTYNGTANNMMLSAEWAG